MGAGAFDDLPIGLDQRIGLPRQRRDLHRELAFETLGGAGGEACDDLFAGAWDLWEAGFYARGG